MGRLPLDWYASRHDTAWRGYGRAAGLANPARERQNRYRGGTMSAIPGSASLPRRVASALRNLIATVYCAVTAAIVSDARPGSHPGI